jgi:hypothetical protein
VTEFNKNKRLKDGHSIYCKICSRSYENAKKKEKKDNDIKIDDVLHEKLCRTCKKTLHIDMFSVNLASSDKRSYVCKDCTPKPIWNSPENIKENKKKYSENFKKNSPEKLKEKYKRQAQKINRKLRLSQNHRIRSALRNSLGGKKQKKTIGYLGCDIIFLKKWLEFQFVDGMSFDNFGEWEIDHVKPCCSFDLSKQEHIDECFNWKNLQPLWRKDNMEKHGKVCQDMIYAHTNKVQKFLSLAQVKEGKLREPPKISSTLVVV